VTAIDQLARDRHSSRSALIREAIEFYLKRRQPNAWPDDVRNWTGDPDFAPFESLRSAEQGGGRDPFDTAAR
jgi:Arc/MetJ-type ribon-helix-helix transcriptional regulator